MKKKLYKITILNDEKNQITLYAHKVEQSNMIGFLEIYEFEFPRASEIILTPGEDAAHELFKNTKRLIIPYGVIIRIEELEEEKHVEIIKIFNPTTN